MAETVTVKHLEPETLTPAYKRSLKNAVHAYGEGSIVKLGKGESTLMTQKHFEWFPNRDGMLQAMVARELGELQEFDDDTLFLDIETDSADERWNQPLYEFFRLGQYAWGEGPVTITTDFNEVLNQIAKAETVIAHNGHNFDFGVLLGDRALNLTMKGKLFDTWTHATLVCPAPFRYTARNGHTYVDAAKPGNARRWFSLDNMAFQFGLDGKIEDEGLKALAKEFGWFGNIPLDDPRYLAYAETDVVVLREVTRSLLEVPYDSDYAIRAQKCAAIYAQMTRNGCLINLKATQARSDQQAREAQETLDWLVQEYGFPTEGKQPWKSKAGKAAIDKMMEEGGANVSRWPKTEKGARSYSGDALKTITEGTPLEAVGERLARVMGQRTLADQLLRDTHADGRIHPDIDALQVSGRLSVTEPGVTTFGTRAETIEKTYFLPDNGFSLVELDLSNADARCVAILSGDKNYAKRFIPGVDGHEISGRLMYGDKEYEAHMPEGWEDNPHLAKENPLRHVAKACIAEGELVLTSDGLVPIEKVTKRMLLWDGESWVSHGGVIYKGMRDVIEYQGLRATKDHTVFTYSAESTLLEIPFGDVAAARKNLVTTGVGGDEIRLSDNRKRHGSMQKRGSKSFRRGEVSSMQPPRVGKSRQLESGEDSRLSSLSLRPQVSLPHLAAQTSNRCPSKMYQPEETILSQLRGTWDNLRFWFCSRSGNVSLRTLRTRRINANRQNRQQQGLCSWELENGYTGGEHVKPTQHSSLGMGPKVLAFQPNCGNQKTKKRNDSGRNYSERERHSCKQGQSLQPRSEKTRVYDILNAGPHNRFTVSGKLVHNCSHAYSYGAGAKKLAATTGQTYETALKFVNAMEKAYPAVTRWQNKVRSEGERGWVVGIEGRKMPCDPDRSWTMAPALAGQNGTTEFLNTTLLRLYDSAPEMMKWLKFPIHDAILVQVPTDESEKYIQIVKDCAFQTLNNIDIFMENGPLGHTWQEAMH